MKKINLFMLLIIISICFYQTSMVFAEEAEWKNYISFELLTGSVYEEDFGRDYPPYRRHVRIHTSFKNMTDNYRITGVEFKARFYDQFGDLAHETEEIRRNINLSPGEISDLFSEFHYYEADDFKQTPYNKLSPIFKEGIPDSEIAVTRIAFANKDTIKFDVLEWEPIAGKKETAWESALYSFDDITGDYESKRIKLTKDRWRIGFVSFNQDTGDILEIHVFDANNDEYITSEKYELEAFAHADQMIINKPGVFYIKTKTEGNFEYSFFISESK